ncbi:MAG: septum site-determining protein MinC [Candidatus Promineifilaceae bacterium]
MMTSSSQSQAVDVKGTRDGIVVTLGAGSFAHLLPILDEALATRKAFLQGTQIALNVGTRPLHVEQLAEIQALFTDHDLTLWTVLAESEETRESARELGLATRIAGSHTDLEGNVIQDTAVSPHSSNNSAQTGINALFLRETIRSGRSIFHEGPVVIYGDVNPGAEILAGGDVIVWGRLRGLVHAGALGDRTATICALELNPTQLRIADQIAIAPDEKQAKPAPEQAMIRNGRIVAEPWQGK